MEKASTKLTLLVELLRGKGELRLSEEGKRGLYHIMCEIEEDVSDQVRVRGGGLWY